MNVADLFTRPDLANVLALGSLMVSVVAMIATWRNTASVKRYEMLLRGDDRIVSGTLAHPPLNRIEYWQCVLGVRLVNCSSRRATVSDVRARHRGQEIRVTWSDGIDAVGDPQGAGGVIAVDSSADLYIRRNDGKCFDDGTIITFRHSFQHEPVELCFQSEWTF